MRNVIAVLVNIISDVHARTEVLADVGKNCDAVICLGDLLLYTDYEDPGNGIMGSLFGSELNTEFIRLRTANKFDEARAIATKKWEELGNREELIKKEVLKQYEEIFAQMPTPVYITYGNVDRPEFWPQFKKEGMTVLDGQVVGRSRYLGAWRSCQLGGAQCRGTEWAVEVVRRSRRRLHRHERGTGGSVALLV